MVPRLASVLTRWFPRACTVCGLAAGPLCPACEDDFFPRSARCRVCAIGMHTDDAVCGRCLADPPAFECATALADYASPVDGMVMALKFGARLDLAALFGGLLAQRSPPAGNVLVVPVPLAYERLAERGFNQSLQIARAYCARSGAALAPDLVRRVRHAPPQQTLALDARHRNVRGAFACRAALGGCTVLVVDDVMTSGSTMNEIARTLRRAGAARVHALIVARTP